MGGNYNQFYTNDFIAVIRESVDVSNGVGFNNMFALGNSRVVNSFYVNARGAIVFPKTIINSTNPSSINEFTSKIEKMEIYLPLKNSRYIEITNETLIQQLEALYKLKMYKGVNNFNIEVAELKPIMDLRYKISNRLKLDDLDNILAKKVYVALGDSFTHGDFENSLTDDYTILVGKYAGENKVYPFLIGNRNNMNIINLAQNGMTIANHGNSNYISDIVLANIPKNVDYITIKIGINDDSLHQNTPLGSIDSSDRTTFYGAYNYIMNYLINNFKNAKIGIIVSNGINDIDMVNATINIAKKYGIPYLNETTDENVPLLIRTLRTDVDESIKNLRDNEWFVNLAQQNRHPNAKCHEFESTIVENFLRRL